MNMTEPHDFANPALRGTLKRNVPMRKYTSWRAGGIADRFYQPADLDDLRVFLRGLPAGEPLYAVGLGSNLLVRDGGLRGTVLMMHGTLGELMLEANGEVYCEAGVPGAKLARFAALHELQGAEFFAGIPGTLGGMLAMNAGCYGSETWQKVSRVKTVDRHGEIWERTAAEYEIGYRHVMLIGSRESGGEMMHQGIPAQQDEFFVGAWMKFSAGDGDSARQRIKTLLSKRLSTQPLNLPNAGSVFRNPEGRHAAQLIEQCGFKGKRIGGAQVSEKHANFIVNTGDATAADIETLIGEMRTAVARQTGIDLYPEIRIVGEVGK